MDRCSGLGLWWRRPAAKGALALGLLVGSAFLAGCSLDGGVEGRRFDELEAAFDADPGAFEAAAAMMESLIDDAPDDVQRVTLTLSTVCHLPQGWDSAADNECRDVDAAEEAVFRGLPNANVVTYQTKDSDRFFVLFDTQDPPVYHIMFAADDENPDDFAGDRGFGSTRTLAAGWTILGPIRSSEARQSQWLG